MAGLVQCMHQDKNLGMGKKEVDGDLAAFIEMRKNEKENSFDATNPDCSVISDAIFSDTLFKMTPADNFLDEDIPKSDHDWLLTPPRTPSIPSSKMPLQNASQIATIKAHTSQPENQLYAPPSSIDLLAPTSDTVTSSVPRIRKPLSSSAKQKPTAPRSATPTGRSTLPSKARSSTPTARGTNSASSNPVAQVARSSTPVRVAPRSATPPARASIPSTTRSAPRSSTPTPRSSVSSNPKTVPAMSKNTAPRVGIVPMVKSRPKPVSSAPVINQPDAPSSNPKMAVPKRSSSVSRGVKNAPLDTGRSALSRSRGFSNGSDDVNPVLMGTKMVERVVNMRKLAPPKHDLDNSHDNSSGKSSSHENSGFGRSLSKKSLDMAIRHMDFRRSVSGNLKKIVTSVSAGSSKASTTTSSSDSPLATSSNTSSEP